jgi:hypothetical protein
MGIKGSIEKTINLSHSHAFVYDVANFNFSELLKRLTKFLFTLNAAFDNNLLMIEFISFIAYTHTHTIKKT